MPAVCAKDIVSEKVLRVAARPCPHREHDKGGSFGNGLRHLDRDHLDLGTKGTRSLKGLHGFPNCHGAVCGLAHRLEPAGPGAARRDKADMANDRHRLIRHRLDRGERG